MDKDICCLPTPSEKTALIEIAGRLEDLLPQAGEIHYKKGHVIFYEGHHPYGFYILKKGEIILSRIAMNGARENLSYRTEGPLGLFHLITNTPHCATATAHNNVELLFIPKSVVLDFLRLSTSCRP